MIADCPRSRTVTFSVAVCRQDDLLLIETVLADPRSDAFAVCLGSVLNVSAWMTTIGRHLICYMVEGQECVVYSIANDFDPDPPRPSRMSGIIVLSIVLVDAISSKTLNLVEFDVDPAVLDPKDNLLTLPGIFCLHAAAIPLASRKEHRRRSHALLMLSQIDRNRFSPHMSDVGTAGVGHFMFDFAPEVGLAGADNAQARVSIVFDEGTEFLGVDCTLAPVTLPRDDAEYGEPSGRIERCGRICVEDSGLGASSARSVGLTELQQHAGEPARANGTAEFDALLFGYLGPSRSASPRNVFSGIMESTGSVPTRDGAFLH